MLRNLVWFCLIMVLLPGGAPSKAKDILDYLPEDALGFVVVRNLEQTDAGVGDYLQTFHSSYPPPLRLLQVTTKIDQGFKPTGDLLVALLPDDDEEAAFQLLVMLPIENYEAFARSISGDPTGNICRVTVAGEQVLLARDGEYAMLMDVENRDTMELLLGLEPEPVELLEPWSTSLTSQNCSLAVMPEGIAFLSDLALKHQKKPVPARANQLRQPTRENQAEKVALVERCIEFLRDEIQMAGIGLNIDSRRNLSATTRIVFQEDAALSGVQATEASTEALLKGIAYEPFASCGSGHTPEEVVKAFPTVMTGLTRYFAETEGYEHFEESDWQDVEKSYRLMVDGVHGVSYLVSPGQTGDVLLSNLSARLNVDNAKQYLESVRQAYELENHIAARSTSDIRLEYKITQTEIDGYSGYQVDLEMAEATGDAENLVWQSVLRMMFGEDGVFNMYFLAVDDQHVFFAMESVEKLRSRIDAFNRREEGLSNHPRIRHTLDLLPEDAQWIDLVDFSGYLLLAERVLGNPFINPNEPETFKQAEESPPVGTTLNFSARQVESTTVVPWPTVEAVAKFFQPSDTPFVP